MIILGQSKTQLVSLLVADVFKFYYISRQRDPLSRDDARDVVHVNKISYTGFRKLIWNTLYC